MSREIKQRNPRPHPSGGSRKPAANLAEEGWSRTIRPLARGAQAVLKTVRDTGPDPPEVQSLRSILGRTIAAKDYATDEARSSGGEG